MDNRPVGIMDSGMGGITVLEAALRELPGETFLYYGDTGNAPYGDKTPEQVFHLVHRVCEFLIQKNCKAIVLACNTATGVAAEALRKEYAFPVIGIEPALKPASLLPGDGKVVVMATQVALSTPKFRRLMDQYGHDTLLLPCPGLMECVERGAFSGSEVDNLLERLLLPCRGVSVKAVVLGCTHYPFLKEAISRHFSPGTPLIDGAAGTARQLRKRLEETALLSDAKTGEVHFFSSEEGRTEKMKQMLQAFHQMKERTP